MTKGDIALDLDKFVVRSEEFIYGNVYTIVSILHLLLLKIMCVMQELY